VDGRLEKVKIDGNILDAIYEEDTDKLIKLGDINIEVGDYPSEIGNIETIIDNSGVLEDTEGTVTEKVEGLIDKVAYELKAFECITNANELFKGIHKFPSRAIINLPNATNIGGAFASWDTEPIPIVEELILNAPNITTDDKNSTSTVFGSNYGVKKVVLNLPEESQFIGAMFSNARNLEELVLNFSTKNITRYINAFNTTALKRIVGVLDFTSATTVTSMFDKCNLLEDVTFEPNTLSLSISLAQSNKLTAESIQSIIDGLATVETAQTLTLNKAIALTDEQKATINAKGWTLAQ
jgi:hypothetical protein